MSGYFIKSAESVTSAFGAVSHLEKQSTTVGYSGGIANTRITTAFRLDGTPVCFQGSPHIGNEDDVKVIGYYERGVVNATILHNYTTGVRYGTVFNADGRLAYVLGIGCLLIGPLLIWPLLPGLFFLIRRYRHDRKVLRLMRAHR